ncbi:MAG: elongation factor G [Candidatus Thiodiazotropha sp.]
MKLTKLRNIGVIAHVDAGKTTATERILFYSGKSHKVGDVHYGTTTTDFSPEERKRGITIYSAATTVFWQKHQVNIIDTPGHIDFNIEVNRSLRVLDGAVVVFDAVAGVEPQSETNWRLADKYGVPRICFVNKMDRVGADYLRTIEMIKTHLGAVPVPVQLPVGQEENFCGVIDLITQKYYLWPDDNSIMQCYQEQPVPEEMGENVECARRQLIEAVVEFDDAALEAYLNGESVSEQQLRNAIRSGTLANRIVPVLCGSAFKNKGVEPLLDAVVAYLPSPQDRPAIAAIEPVDGKDIMRLSSNAEPLACLAFKIVTDKHGTLTFVRIYSGQLTTGDIMLNTVSGHKERVGRIYEMHADKRESKAFAQTGDIVALSGLKHTATGHTLCNPEHPLILESISVPDPVIDIAIEPKSLADQTMLMKCLHSLVKDDPSLSMRSDSETGQLIMSGMGELQLEVTLNKLVDDFGVLVNTGKPKVSYRETISRTREIQYRYKKQDGGAGHFADLLLKFEPLERGAGIEFINSITGGLIPKEFIPSVEAGVRRAADTGVAFGYPLVDFKATLLDGDYHKQDSSPYDFEIAASLALREVVVQAEPRLLEPVMLVEVTTPSDYLGDCIGDLNRRRGLILNQQPGRSMVVIDAHVPLATMFGYIGDLRALTSGRANYTMQFDHYAIVPSGLVDQISG